jgi:hypothetical protein
MKDTLSQETNNIQGNRFHRKDIWLLLIVMGISLFLNLLGFGWGKDGYVPWSPDSIEGEKAVKEIPNLFGTWTNKYPRLQFLIDGLCYMPFIHFWKTNSIPGQGSDNTSPSVLTQEQYNTLATISRINIIILSALIILWVYLIARFYYADSTAAFFASLSLAVTSVFVYYNHTSCVDIPSMFWITLGVYLLLKSVSGNKLFHHIMMAIAFACAGCTKDPMLFYTAAFALAYIVLRIGHLRKQGLDFKACLLKLLNRNTCLAIGAFLFVFALLQGILFSPKAYWERMGVWVGGRGVKEFNYGFDGQWNLLTSTLWSFYWAIGWPLLVLFFISLIVTSKKHWLFNLVVVIVPLILFYVLVSMRIHMSYIRYYLPVMGLLYLPVGIFIAHLFTLKVKWLSRVSLLLVGACYMLSMMYCFSIDMELIHDSRYQAAEWFKANVNKDTTVFSLIRYPYGLQLSKFGYPKMDEWAVPPLQDLQDNQDNLPEYIVLSNSNWLTIATPEAVEYKKALLEGTAGYSNAAEFRSKGFMSPRKNWLTIASWPIQSHFEEISPEIIVMQKKPAK